MNGIICMGRGRGCVPVTIGEGGSTAKADAADATSVERMDSGIEIDRAVTAAKADPEPPASYWPPPRTDRSPNLVVIPANTQAERCTGIKCRARKEGPAMIYKVLHPKTGNLTPAAVSDTITLAKDGAVVPTGAFAPYLDAAPSRETIMRAGMGYSHFIDCPDAPQFKRK